LLQVFHPLSFKKKERLKSEKAIDCLFKLGKSKTYGCIRMVYLFTDEELPFKVQVMFSVPKKNHKSAIKRNLLKRRMREIYRLNKNMLISHFGESQKNIFLAFLYNDSEVKPYFEIEKSLKYLLNFLTSK
jgi:ribonuclease P protein component